jgi:hypothetical protein
VSSLLEESRLRGDRQRPLCGLRVETSDRVSAGIGRYVEHMPIVFGSAIGGPDHSPTISFETCSSLFPGSGRPASGKPSTGSIDCLPNPLERLSRLQQGTSEGDDTEAEPG